MLRVAYHDFIKFEKSCMSYLPLLEKRKKIKLKKFTGEKIILLHILSEYDYFYLFTGRFLKIIPPSRFKCKKYNSLIGFSANFDIQYFQI